MQELLNVPGVGPVNMPPIVNANINTTPNPFNSNIHSLSDTEILRLIMFYNDSFGIVARDDTGERRRKLALWLTRLL